MARRSKLITPLPVLGIDKSKPGEYVAARASTNARNVRIKRSVIEKRPGTGSLGVSLAERVMFLTELDDGLTTHFVRIGMTKFEELNKDTLIWTSRAHAALTGTITDQFSVAYPLLSGSRILVYTNGKDAVRKWTGSGNDAVLGGSPPLAEFVLAYSGYLLLLNIIDGGTRFPWRIQWCDTGLPETWSGGNAGSQNLLEDSNDITGGGYFGQYFTVHKENAIYVCYLTQNSTVFRFERRDTGAGTISHKTIQSLPTGEQAFLARDGIRVFNGTNAPLIESPINDEIRDFLNPENAYKAWSKVVRELDEYWVGFPIGSDTEPDTIFKFNYVTRQCHIDKRTNVCAIGEFRNTQGQVTWDELATTWDGWNGAWDDIFLASLNPVLVFGTSAGVTTQQDNSSSDNGTAIDAYWDSKDFVADDFGLDAGLLMEWQGAHIWARGSGSIDVYYSLDGGASFALAGSITLTSDYPADVSPQIVYFDGFSSRCRLRVRHTTNAQRFDMKQFALMAVPREETDY